MLDYLADDLVANGWSRKRLIKQIVSSRVYRQSSAATSQLTRRDPANRLLARQNRYRLPGELIRDQYLAAAGLLNRKVGGRSFRPPLPDGLGEIQFVNQWQADEGDALYRRGMYIHLQRNLMLPMLMTFDHPDAIIACTRRERSNTPLQALSLLNGPMFVEAAQTLGRSLAGQKDRTIAARITDAYLATVNRLPNNYEQPAFSTIAQPIARDLSGRSCSGRCTGGNKTSQ